MASIFKKLMNYLSEPIEQTSADVVIDKVTDRITNEIIATSEERKKKLRDAAQAERARRKDDLAFLTRSSTKSESEYATFINNNFAQTDYVRGRAFVGTTKEFMIKENKSSMSLKIDSKRSLVFDLNSKKELIINYVDNANGSTTSLFDETDSKSRDFAAIEQRINKFYMEVNPNSDIVKNYSYTEWSTAYQKVTDIEKKKEVINDIYNQLLDSTFYNEAQARVLARAMLLDYDINCFSNPLYTPGQMEQLVNVYKNVISAAQSNFPDNVSNDMTKLQNSRAVQEVISRVENRYRDMNKFCSNNFKYKFSESEFTRVRIAAEQDKLKELSSDPNLPAKFKLFYAIDESTLSGEAKKINIGNKVFVINSSFVFSKSGEPVGLNTVVSEEIKDKDGKVKLNTFYKELNGKKPWGELEPFYEAYKSKYLIKDSMQLLEFYKQEVKNGIIDDTNDNNEITLKLANGEELLVEGLRIYSENTVDKIEDNDNLVAGVRIRYKSNDKVVNLYSDFKGDKIAYYNISTLLRKCGGIIPDERVMPNPDREKNIENEILSKKDNNNITEYLPAEDMYKKYHNMAIKDGISGFKTPNGDIFKFERDSFIKDGKKIVYTSVAYKPNEGEYDYLYKVDEVNGKNVLRGKRDKFHEYYEKSLYEESLDSKISNKTDDTKKDKIQGNKNKTNGRNVTINGKKVIIVNGSHLKIDENR